VPHLESDAQLHGTLYVVCASIVTMTVLQFEVQFGLAVHAFVDSFLAGAMCYYLQRGRTGLWV
jgi:hypothetical protein